MPLPTLATVDSAALIDGLSPGQLQAFAESAAGHMTQVASGVTSGPNTQSEVDKQLAGHLATVDRVTNKSTHCRINYSTFGGQNTGPSSIRLKLNLPLFLGHRINSGTLETEANMGRMRCELDGAPAGELRCAPGGGLRRIEG